MVAPDASDRAALAGPMWGISRACGQYPERSGQSPHSCRLAAGARTNNVLSSEKAKLAREEKEDQSDAR